MNRRRRRGTVAALVTAAALAAVPGMAAARDGRLVSLPSTTAAFSLRGSNGYSINVQTFRTGMVALYVTDDNVVAQYMVDGHATPRGLEADFGPFGRISVRFQARNVRPVDGPPPRGCEGRGPLMESGRFKGTIRFRGERGYTSVSRSVADGSLFRTFKMTCHVPGGQRPAPAFLSEDGPAPGGDTISLGAAARTGGRVAFLEIDQLQVSSRPSPVYFVLAGTGEWRGKVMIQRRATLEVPPTAVTVTPLAAGPSVLTVNAFGPLGGTGTYLSGVGSAPSWTGNLSVRLPGAGEVPLTGPAFSAAFCRGGEGTAEFDGCDRQITRLLSPVKDFPFFSRKP